MRGPHCESRLHATHRCASQAPPVAKPMQSADVQQLPATQRPSQHTEPAPQSVSTRQAPHWWFVHSSPPGQSAPAQQLPCVHRPPQHTEPEPHCAFVVHAVHEWFKHTRGVQSFDPQQSPGRQPPPQQR